MAFFTRQHIGRVYVLRMVLPCGTVVHKIGMCNTNRTNDRMMEILSSWFNKFRFVPYTELKLNISCQDPQKLEKYIHKILAPVAFTPNHKVSGGTEMFTDVDEKRLIWFIRAAANSMYVDFPEVDDDEVMNICKLLTV